LSAIITARNAKKKFPDSRYNEDLSFYILKSYYSQAHESVESKQYDRFIDAKDECYSFLKEYPSTKYAKEVEAIQHKIEKYFEHHKN
jgi:outer membrane protein assembly factor BamD